MKTNTEFYSKTVEELVKERNAEKNSRGNKVMMGFTIITLLLLFIYVGEGLILGIYGFISYMGILFFWDKKPWIKSIKLEDICDTEVQYKLSIQIKNTEKKIRNKATTVNELYETLDPRDIKKQIQSKEEILSLDKEILDLIQNLFLIEDALGIAQNSEFLVMKEELIQEIGCVELHLKELKK